MPNQKKSPFALIFTALVAFVAIFGVFKEGKYGTPAATPRGFAAELPADYLGAHQGKVVICYYDIQAVEERRDTTLITTPNQAAQLVVSVDRYWQDKPFRQPLPGKVRPEDDKLLSTIPVQEKGGRVVAIASVEKVPKSCKVYDFTPDR